MSSLKESIPNKRLRMLFFAFIASSLSLALLSGLVANGVTRNFDVATLEWINSHANPAFDTFFVAVTQLAGVLAVSGVTLLLTLYFVFVKQYHKALFVALSVGGASLLGYALKSVFDRPRPDLWEWIVVETNFSFPSGHATASMALALCIVVLLWRTKWRTATIAVMATYVAVIGFSRLYLGVHFPTDILGGWLLSLGWASLITVAIYGYKVQRQIVASK